MSPKRSRKSPSKPKAAKVQTITKDGLFISRAMRRDAEAAAKAEADSKALAEADYADAQDAAAYAAQTAAQTDAERAFNTERALAQANAEARKKYHLE